MTIAAGCTSKTESNALSAADTARNPASGSTGPVVTPTGTPTGNPTGTPNPNPTSTATPNPTGTPTGTPTVTPTGSAAKAPSLSYGTQSYPYSVYAFFQGISALVKPSNIGAPITDCSISPALPAGMTFSRQDCSISGTPTAVTGHTFYTVTATGNQTTSQTLISISTYAPAPLLNLAQPMSVYVSGTAASDPLTELSGGLVASNCSMWGAPAGLGLGSNCTLQGTTSALGNYSAQIVNFTLSDIQLVNFQVPGFAQTSYWQGTFTPSVTVDVIAAGSPFLSFDSQFFGAATFVANQTINPIAPTNQGGAIASCAINPALPAGLTLSQSDCSISGTPTAPTAPNTYVITPMGNGNATGNTLKLTLTVTPAIVNALSCQSDTLCVHTRMPVWSQADPKLWLT